MTIEDELRSHYASLDRTAPPAPGDLGAVIARGRRLRRRRRTVQVLGGVGLIGLVTLSLGSILRGGAPPAVVGSPQSVMAVWEMTEGGAPYAKVPGVDPLVSVGLSGPNGITLVETPIDERWLIGWWRKRLDLVSDLKVYESRDGAEWTVTSVEVDGLANRTIRDAAGYGELAVALFDGDELAVATSLDLRRWTVEELPAIAGPADPPSGALWNWSRPTGRLIPWGNTPVIRLSSQPELNVSAWWQREFPGREIPTTYSLGADETGFVLDAGAGSHEVPFDTVFPEGQPADHEDYLVRDDGAWRQPADLGLVLRANTSHVWSQAGDWYSLSTAVTFAPYRLDDFARWTGDEWETIQLVRADSVSPTAHGVFFLEEVPGEAFDQTLPATGFRVTLVGYDGLRSGALEFFSSGGMESLRHPEIVSDGDGDGVVVVWERSAFRPETGRSPDDFEWAFEWAPLDLTNPGLQRGIGNGLGGSVYQGGLLLARQDVAPDSWWVFDLRD
jgi:hypothetical protein